MGFKRSSSETPSNRPAFVSCFQARCTKFVEDDLELSCVVSGNPNPQITWKYNDQIINPNDNPRMKGFDGNRKLVIRMLTIEDAGVYTCIAKNQHDEVRRTCHLVVQRHPYVKPPEIIMQPQDVEVRGGQETTISCLVPFSRRSLYAFIWTKNGQDVRETQLHKYGREMIDDHTVKATLQILNVGTADQGRYQLRFANFYGHAVSNEAVLSVV